MNPQFEKHEALDLSKVSLWPVQGDIDKFEHHFNPGAILGRALVSAMDRIPGEQSENKKGKGDDTETSSLQEQASEEVLSRVNMKAQHEETLKNVGLQIRSEKGGWFVLSGGDDLDGNSLRLDIENGEKFITYLHALSPETINEQQAVGIARTIKQITSQFRNNYDFTNPEDPRPLELIGSLDEIISECKRLGEKYPELRDSTNGLEAYKPYIKQGIISEYLEAGVYCLDAPFTGKGFTLRWHIDATPVFLEDKWNKVLDFLQRLASSEKTQELYKTARSTADEALSSAEIELMATVEKEKAEGKKDGLKTDLLLNVIKKIKARFQEF